MIIPYYRIIDNMEVMNPAIENALQAFREEFDREHSMQSYIRRCRELPGKCFYELGVRVMLHMQRDPDDKNVFITEEDQGEFPGLLPDSEEPPSRAETDWDLQFAMMEWYEKNKEHTGFVACGNVMKNGQLLSFIDIIFPLVCDENGNTVTLASEYHREDVEKGYDPS